MGSERTHPAVMAEWKKWDWKTQVPGPTGPGSGEMG